MGIVVLLEMESPPDSRIIGSGRQPMGESAGEGGQPAAGVRVRWAHAAPTDPDIPGDPGPQTACGLDTGRMMLEHWQPTGPGQGWLPPQWAWRACPICDAVVRGR